MKKQKEDVKYPSKEEKKAKEKARDKERKEKWQAQGR
jgi:hypothetical protein